MKSLVNLKKVFIARCLPLALCLCTLAACQPHDPFAYAHYRVQRRQLQEELEGLRIQLIRYPNEQVRSTYRELRRELVRIEQKMTEMRGT